MVGLTSVDIKHATVTDPNNLPVADIIPKDLAIKRLRTALGAIMNFHPHIILTGSERFPPIAQVLSEAVAVDKQKAQDEVLEAYTIIAVTHNDFRILKNLFYLPEMTADPLQVVDWNSQKCVLYNNTYIPVTDEAAKVTVLETGKTLLLQNKEGRTIGVLDNKSHFKIDLSLGSIETCANNQTLSQQCEQAFGYQVNMVALPIKGRVYLQELFQKDQQRTNQLLSRFGTDIVSYFAQFNNLEDLEKGIKLIEHLDRVEPEKPPVDSDTEPGYRSNTARQLIENIAVAEFCAPVLSYRDDAIPTGTLIKRRLQSQCSELLALYEKNLPPTQEEWNFTVNAFAFIVDVPIFIHAMNYGLEHAVHLPYRHPDFLTQVFDYAGKYPEAPNIYQTYYELILLQQIFTQDNLYNPKKLGKGIAEPLHKGYKKLKEWFYKHYNIADIMSREAPTTDPETDRLRAESLVLDAVKKGPENGGLPRELSVFFGGIGKGARFEGPFCEDLEKQGVVFRRIVAADKIDYTAEYPDNLKQKMKDKTMEFIKADFSDDSFSVKEQFDLVILPWSVLSDIIMKKDVVIAMEKFRKMLKPGGMLILDIPFPVGEKGYVPMMKNQLWYQQVLGIVQKGFKHGSDILTTFLNIIPIQEVLELAMMSGLGPGNLPSSPAQLQAMIQVIENHPELLAQQHRECKDKDAVKYPFWEAKKWPRATLAFFNLGREQIEKLFGLTPSFLLNITGVRELVKS